MFLKINKRIVVLLSSCVVLTIIFIGVGTPVHAQNAGTSLQNISYNITPEFPVPNTATTIRISSVNVTLDTATITWSLNGKTLLKGIGERSFPFVTGNIGIASTIDITISPAKGSLIQKKIVITPIDVDLVWNANTYVHPFYKGKADYTYGSAVTVIALPALSKTEDVLKQSKNLIYKWSMNGGIMGDFSGYGKNSVTIPSSVLPLPITIGVDVRSSDGGIHSYKEIVLNPAQPKVLVYENNPLYGIDYNTAVGNNYNLSSSEVTLSAVPYYFSIPTKDYPSLSYLWSINNQNFDSGDSSDVTFKQNGAGSSKVSVMLKNAIKTIQRSDKSFTISYQ